MATYISTLNFTDKGMQAIGDTAKRAAAFKAAAKKIGAKVTEVYWTLGSFDGLIIFEAPDDETATAAMLLLASKDTVRTSTCRAFDATTIGKIVAKLPK
jgi:uncharacterized protein with GYD domain